MATSPLYSWPEPDNSSLVKNGAQDIRALGDAIDTSVWNSGYGQAGKNKIINGDFGIWQRGTSISAPDGSGTFLADRFLVNKNGSGGTTTVSRQSFTSGSAPVAGYESAYFLRYANTVASTGQSFQDLQQRIEDVRVFAGQTVTLSFWAKFGTSAIVLPIIQQQFGSGGSSGVATVGSNITVGTSWTRYSQTFTIPSVSGKTIGTGSNLEIDLRLPSNTVQTFDTWGWQLEYGSKATPFQTASGGSPQAELAMCQRYFNRIADFSAGGSNAEQRITVAQCFATTGGYGGILFSPMRSIPSVTFSGNADFIVTGLAGNNIATTAMSSNSQKPNSVEIRFSVATGLIAGNATFVSTAASTGKIDLSAEL